MRVALPGSGFLRWMKFNAVGALGIAVQLGTLALLKSVLDVNYLLATGLAVEAALLNNFLWHEAFTWRDRKATNRLSRWIKFNLTAGALSIAGNLLSMKLLLGIAGLNYLAANLLSILACTFLNFVIADRIVFVLPLPERH
jgi:putative flippase GtrA